ncbi:AAA family ATPase [Flagellimonas flava]|uniref:Predicted ATPase n=1 Tax=Flagellimonas flava TaxID=570519 RepID=A0A1M5NLR6_9FLAO|nr:AAA family ATPase [Allomuricauda flava]SHG89873.1 Predicted ATPase [Allomuricauda flava]
MSFTAKFSDVRINVQNIDGKPMLIEKIHSERRIESVFLDVPHILKPLGSEENHISYDFMDIEKFDPPIPRTETDFIDLLNSCLQVVQALKSLHQKNMSIGTLSSSRIALNEKKEIMILGNSLFREIPFKSSSEVYALEDLYFSAPENYENTVIVADNRSDFYSLGINLYTWVTGSLPFKGNDKLELTHQHLTKTPIAPSDINPKVHPSFEELILILLAKNPNERYASAFGLFQDLSEISEAYKIDEDKKIQLHRDYNPGRIEFASILFGREDQLGKLEECYKKVGYLDSQIVFVEGYSGVGKTSLINKFIDGLSPNKNIVLEGKFDQFKNTPYSAIQSAFTSMERQLLLNSKLDTKKLQETLKEALGKNAGVLKEIIPGISAMVPKLEVVEALNPIETRNRFVYVFQKFFEAVADLGLKIILFLDDWQWCDVPSLELVNAFVKIESKNVFFLFAYRGNEIDSNHHFHRFKTEIEKRENYSHLLVSPLNRKSANEMIANTLGMNETDTSEFTKLIFPKTEGNPFYIKQFINSLHQNRALSYDYDKHVWRWKKSMVGAKNVSDNVVGLISKKIDKLSYEAQIIFKVASCISGRFDLDLISEISGIEKVLMPILLDISIGSGYIIKTQNDGVPKYSFAHDRVQQAAYHLQVPSFNLSNEKLHYRLGKTLLKKKNQADYSIGEILLHFVNAKEHIEIDIAKAIIKAVLGQNKESGLSITPEASKQYFELGLFLVDKFEISQYRFQCLHGICESLFLLGDLESAEIFANKAFSATTKVLEKVQLLRMKMLFYESYAMYERNIQTGLEALELFNIQGRIHFENNGLEPLIQKEYELFNSLAAKDNLLQDLAHRKMTSPEDLVVMDVLVNMNASAYFVDLYLFAWSTLKMTNQTLEKGLTHSTPFALVFMGSLLVAFYKEFDYGYEFGKIGVDLLSHIDNDQYKCRTLSIFPIFIQHFKEPILAGTSNLDESIYSGLETGDLPYAGYSFYAKVRDAFLAGDDLIKTLEICDESIVFMEKVNNQGLLALMKLLKGSLLKLLGRFDPEYQSKEMEALKFLQEVKFFTAISHHYIFRSWVCCMLKEFEEASILLKQNEEIVIYAASQPHVPKHYFLDSLCILYLNESLTKKQEEKVKENQGVLNLWSNSMPDNFSAEYYLIETLLKGRSGKIEEALGTFNLALKWAEKGGLRGVKAFAYEIASDMLKSSDYSILAEGFEKNVNSIYEQWNAVAKAKKGKNEKTTLDYTYSDLTTESLIRSMQVISSEVNKGDVVEKLLNVLMEKAGADRSVLILIEKGHPYIEAEINLNAEKELLVKEPLGKQKSIPISIIEYVISSKKEFVFDSSDIAISVDKDYIEKTKIQSLLALPLIRQKELIGVLYLENRKFQGLFQGNDLDTLKVIASQAAISIYNTLLFEEASELNIALQSSKDELSKMNLLLEDKIKDRTKVLRQEIETRKEIEEELKKAQKEAEKFHQQQIKEERRESLQSKMMMLSSQMNPHFIFNSLGSVQSYILNNDTNRAVDFISEFAGLMRKNLINSTTKYISIAEELEFLDKYLLLEKIRFNDSFEYHISEEIDNPHDTLIPPMLLQPFIENAVIHGLSKLEGRKGSLKVHLDETEDRIICIIEDNGIGRENALKHKSQGHKSVAISNLETRLELLNDSSEDKEYTYEILDLKDKNGPSGTRVKVCFPNDLH